MENGQDTIPETKPETREAKLDKFVDNMLDDAIELRAELREQGNRNDIKDRITCLKYLEEIVKAHFLLKKASKHDPAAAGSVVRKYASAFAKNATGVGKKGRGRPAAKFAPSQPDTLDLDGDGDDDTAT